MNTSTRVGAVSVVRIFVAAVGYAVSHGGGSGLSLPPDSNSSSVLDSSGPAAPEFTGIVAWDNSPPLTLASLRGKVVLVDFWTYSCINCQRTIPHLQQFDQAYR